MVNDDLPTTAKPRKYRILTNNQSNGTPTITSRLPSLLSKSSVFPSTSGMLLIENNFCLMILFIE
jgi:hypothetical protein